MRRKKQLVLEATRRAMEVRKEAELSLTDPVCIYDLAEKLEVDVRFAELPTIEGVYYKGSPSHIIITSLRPAGRQNFTCGHELGHHAFNHGDRIDNFVNGQQSIPDEFLADCFAGLLLMPKTAVSQAFTIRGWRPQTSTPIQVYTIARWFGVGYSTLILHMSRTLGILPATQAQYLGGYQPKSIRKQILGEDVAGGLIMVDFNWHNRAIDVQVGDLIYLPPDVRAEKVGERFSVECITQNTQLTLFRALTPGISQLYHQYGDWAAFVRVSRRGFVGRSIYRHLEDPDDD